MLPKKRFCWEVFERGGQLNGRILRRTRTCRERHKHDTPPRKTAHGAQQTAPQVPARHPVQFPARSPRPNRSNWLILLVLVSTTSGVVFCKGEWEWATPVCERGSEAVAVEKCETKRPTAPDQNGTGADTWQCLKASATSARRKKRVGVLFWSAFARSICRQEGRDECAERTPSSTAGPM